VLPQILVGLGMSTLFLPLTTLALADIRPHQMAAAAGLQNFMRTLFGAFGTALATSYWDHGITRHHALLTENVTRYDAPTRDALGALQPLGSSGGPAMLDRMIEQQAAVLSLQDFFLLAAVLVLAMSPLIWIAHRPKAAVDTTRVH
jgi:DHA2 family multidrug resistance protein